MPRYIDPYVPYTPRKKPAPYVSVVSVKEWIVTSILLAIPVVDIVALFVWAFSGDTNPSKKTFAKAALLILFIAVVLAVIAVLIVTFAFGINLDDYMRNFRK